MILIGHMIRMNDTVWYHRRDGGWTIFCQCEDPTVEGDKITPFLVATLVCNTVKAEGI